MRQPHKMVKHTQTIRRLQPTNVFSVFDHFVGLAHEGLNCNESSLCHRQVRTYFIPTVFIQYNEFIITTFLETR